ncbi:hypothetical protein ES707_17656 [subsurface metagenome]
MGSDLETRNYFASPMKKLHLDTERILYRLIFGEGMMA